MSGGDATVGLVIAASVGVASAGPLLQVFNEMGAVLAIMGAGGGGLRALWLSVPIRQAVRPVLIGGMVGFGTGILGVPVVEKLTGIEIDPTQDMVRILAAVSFVLGYSHERVLALLDRAPPDGGADG